MSANDIPCRVTAELNQHLRMVEKTEARAFDHWDENLMKDLCGNFAPAMQELLIKLEQIDKTQQSFGADKERSYDFILPTLYKLRDACMEAYRQL